MALVNTKVPIINICQLRFIDLPIFRVCLYSVILLSYSDSVLLFMWLVELASVFHELRTTSRRLSFPSVEFIQLLSCHDCYMNVLSICLQMPWNTWKKMKIFITFTICWNQMMTLLNVHILCNNMVITKFDSWCTYAGNYICTISGYTGKYLLILSEINVLHVCDNCTTTSGRWCGIGFVPKCHSNVYAGKHCEQF